MKSLSRLTELCANVLFEFSIYAIYVHFKSFVYSKGLALCIQESYKC